jgi:ribosomal protein S18 acetylase RimI-like enzyme
MNTDAIRTILNQNPVWSAYALADLQPAFAPYCRWLVAENDEGPGVVLLFSALTPCVLFTTGSSAAVQAALAQAAAQGELPAEVYISVPEAHLPVVANFYDFGGAEMAMWRMALTSLLPGKVELFGETRLLPALPVVRLGPADAGRIRALYTNGGPFTPDAFDPYQLDNGVFYGIQAENGVEHDEFVAVGGTHIVDWTSGVAAIGNMYTRPDCRGQGLASAVLAAIVGELQERQVRTIVLNVNQRNGVARRLYERRGFAVHCSFWEGVGRLRAEQNEL